uniref:Uncharacterized protein n=1 Tax=Pavo cristatus TaxID=9049 RepID=A0A8C9EH65_PAVCR
MARNSSIRAALRSASGRLSLPRFPGSLGPGGGLGAPVPPRKALLSAAMAAPSGRAAVLLRRGHVPGLSPVPRRYLYKKKWATTSPRIPATRLALHHFDNTYSLQLQERWPAVRAAMLCEQKYGALLNNFASADLTAQQLELLSATDFVSEAARRAQCWQESAGVEVERRKSSLEGSGGDEMTVPTETSPLLHASVSSNIKCYTFPRGDISRFHPAW